jgi:hypothetical protein
MKRIAIKKCLSVISILLLLGDTGMVAAQTVRYSREEAYINNPDDLQLAANIAGNHHLLSFSHNEEPEIFIYNGMLELIAKKTLQFKFPEKAAISIIPFDDFYYCSVHPRFSQEYLFYKIDGAGNITDMSVPFKKLLHSQSANLKVNFQLIPNKRELWMVYHTALDDPEKSTVVMVRTDSLLNVVFAHKVQYDFKMTEEKLQHEVLIFGRYLLVLKTLESGSSLQLMKVNLATGYTITNTFHSPGYLYSQPSFSFNIADSSTTVAAMIAEPFSNTYSGKQFIFISRMNKILIEQTPSIVLKTQFKKNASTNFVLIDGASKWMRFKKGSVQTSDYIETPITVYRPLTSAEAIEQNAEMDNLISKLTPARQSTSTEDLQGVRFSLLDKDFKITSDSLISNTKNSYTLKANQFTRFTVNNKEYVLVGQQFSTRKNGLLLVNANASGQLVYNYVKAYEKFSYLLAKSRNIDPEGIIVPYLHKREAGLLKISLQPGSFTESSKPASGTAITAFKNQIP